MNKSILRALIAAVAGMLLAGCAKEPAGGGEGIPMRVAPSLEDGTRASLTTDGLTEFYLQLGCADAAYGYFGKVTKSGADWAASKQLFWKDRTTPVNCSAAFFGSHAFTEDVFANGVDLTVPADQSTQAGLNSADLLTFKATEIKYEDTAGGVLPVELSHGLAKVNFVLTLGEAFYDAKLGLTDSPVTAFTVKGANAGFEFAPQTGDVTVKDATQANFTPLQGAYTPGTATAKAATAIFEAILVPQSFAAGELSIIFSIGTGNYEWSNASAITLSAGTTVNLPLSATVAPKPRINGYEYVDLGLSVKWATCNVGAFKPEDYGDLFAWGETAPKADYSWSTLQYCMDDSGFKFSKYVPSYQTVYWGGEGWPDNRTVLDAVDDAATANWGGSWRMPTDAEWKELLEEENCSRTWTEKNEVDGLLFTSRKNGATLFLPVAGYREGTSLRYAGAAGYYWSSSLSETYPRRAFGLVFHPSEVDRYDRDRAYGLAVRPVAE